MKLKIWEISLMTAFVIAVLGGILLDNGQSEMSDKLIRLHVVANSDKEEDQALKLIIRDAVLGEIDQILTGSENKAEAQEKIEYSMTAIQHRAEEVIEAQGMENSVSVSLETEHFPTREYDTFSLPAGKYTSLRVSIGEAKGKNWWCVVFPPLCMEAAEEEAVSLNASGLTYEEVALITEEDTGHVIKFKALEILDEIKGIFGK